MTSTKALSIVIPFKGEGAYLTRSVRSALTKAPGSEVIVVEQNLSPVAPELLKGLDVRHISHTEGGAAAARNRGARESSREFVYFLDDDAYLQLPLEDLLAELSKDTAAIVFEAIDDHNEPHRPYPSTKLELDRTNVYRFLIEFTALWRAREFAMVGGFDEGLGVGTYFASDESADLGLRLVAANQRVLFVPEKAVCHPLPYGEPLIKFYRYGRGTGRLLVKHRLGQLVHSYLFWTVFGSIGGIFVSALRGERRALERVARLMGVGVGLFQGLIRPNRTK